MSKLNLPIVFHHATYNPTENGLLIKGSKGFVSVFNDNSLLADYWTKKEVKEFIKNGVWIVVASGNVDSFVDFIGEEL